MKTILLFCSVCLVAISWTGVKERGNTLKEMNLNGPVKLVIETVTITEGNEQKTNGTKYTFNLKGNLTEQSGYHNDGNPTGKAVYTYDLAGILLELNRYHPGGSHDYKITYVYDEKGRKSEQHIHDAQGNLEEKTVHKYDSQDFLIAEAKYRPIDTLLFSSVYIYVNDSNGKIIEELRFKSSGILEWNYVWVYNTKGKVIETYWKNADGKPLGNDIYVYDSHGNISSRKRYNPDGTVDLTLSYTYEYDSNLNWIKKWEVRNGAPSWVTTREIIYYE